MIEPDFFGCSAKLPFAETEALAAAGDGGDFSILRCDGEIATSIDRVHRCARDWGRFARIALNHAFGDVVCAGSAPLQVMLSFEFGVDAEGGADTAACSSAFADGVGRATCGEKEG